MSNIKLSNLRSFVAIYEERSISGAARKIHTTQSGVSVQLRDLEEHLNVSLFERISTGVVPTKAGERVYQRAISVLNEVNQLDEDISAMADKVMGEVRVGIMPTMARAILAPVVVEFAQANPLVDVRITEGYSGLLTEMVLAGDAPDIRLRTPCTPRCNSNGKDT